MASKAVLLLEHAPKFSAKGGLFFVDFGTEGIPTVALSPAIMLKAITKAKSEYLDWLGGQGPIGQTGQG